MKILNLKKIDNNVLRAVFDVEMPSGMILHGCKLFVKPERVWVAPPSVRRVGPDGKPLSTKEGRPLYEDVVSFVDRDRRDRWASLVMDVLATMDGELLPELIRDCLV